MKQNKEGKKKGRRSAAVMDTDALLTSRMDKQTKQHRMRHLQE